MANPFIADTYFKENPSKVLGEQSVRKGRFGSDVIVVSGDISNIQKIDAEPVKTADLYPSSVQTFVTEEKAIEQVFETEIKKEHDKKLKKLRGDKEPKKETENKAKDLQQVYSYDEINKMYNQNISRDELEAYYFCNPELNYKLLFDFYKNTKEQLVEKNLICYDHETKSYAYYYSYVSGNVNKKISNAKRDQAKYIEIVGQKQYEKQLKMLESAKPVPKGFIGNEKIILLPHSNLSKEVKITELRYGKPELYGETSIFNAFKQWLRYLPSDMFEKSTYREIIEYYLDNKAPNVSKNLSKEERVREEKKRVNAQQRSKEEGDRLFEKFLAEELLAEDQSKLSYIWNEKFNSIVEPDLSKIPVCFRISKTFKSANKPLRLNPTQRQAIAFMMEKKSGLLAYGVGVGKTLASIACVSQAIDNGLSKYPCFVVPTNTYDKWIGELQGFVNKQTGIFEHGALPHLPEVQGLYNLNPTIVYDKLKIYSKEDQAILDSIQEAISYVKDIDSVEISEARQKKIDKIYSGIAWVGISNDYQLYIEESKAKNAKTFVQFVADYLKDEYNYKVYELGTIKSFPVGTIFVITEVGLQRLGVSDENKEKLTGRLYNILSQGEMTADKNSKRDIAALQVKIEQTVSSSLKNAKLNIEDLGIDFACFDEAHYYKKLFTYVKGQVTGEEKDWKTGEQKNVREKTKYELKSAQYPSSRALSAFVLSHYVQQANKNRNVIQLTATPFTNSPLEVFSMLTLTNYGALEDMGLDNMIDFFDTFMRITYDIKYTPQKTVVKDISLTGYNNLSQLRQIIYSLMDKKDEGSNIIRPNKIIYPSLEKGIETTIPMTSEQEELMNEVKKYLNGNNDYDAICKQAMMDEIEGLDFDALDDEVLITEYERITNNEYTGEREDLSESKREQLIKAIKNKRIEGIEMGEEDLSEDESLGVRILKGLSMMRQITLSPYLYYKACKKAAGAPDDMPNYKDYVNSSPKFKYVMGCISSAINWHKNNNTKISGQVIYMNVGTEYFPLLKQYLVKEIGLSETQVGIVSGGMSKTAKESIKNKFLSGDILVLIGSSTISVGVDLQNNATSLYNCYYDWNPTDAQQIEGRIWRQGNRFANVRIVYPMCYNSADPVLFEYLNSKTLRINEIWNRSSTIQELDLRDFNPKELQKKLITDPEEKADFEILMESEIIESQIIYYENRRDSLRNAVRANDGFKELRPIVSEYLNELSAKKSEIAKTEAIKNQKEKINEIVEKYSDNADKMASEIAKYKASRYDHENDPEGKYVVENYNVQDDLKLYTDAAKYLKIVEDWNWKSEEVWGNSLTDKQYKMERDFQKFRGDYKEMMAAQDKILKPLGLSFETAANPLDEMNAKIEELQKQLTDIESSKDERVKRLKEELLSNRSNLKTVEDRVKEFASQNDKLLSELMFLGENKPEIIEIPKPEETVNLIADDKLKNIEEKTKDILHYKKVDNFLLNKVNGIIDSLKKYYKVEGYNKSAKALNEDQIKESIAWLKDMFEKYPELKNEISKNDYAFIEEKVKQPEPVAEIKPQEFTFLKDNPMQKARALQALEKRIKSDGIIMNIYEWVESLPKDLKVEESKIHSSKSEKGYVIKMTIGDFIANSKAEIDYYNYLVSGGYPYSSYLKDEEKKAKEIAEQKKIEKEKQRILDIEKQKEQNQKILEAKNRQIKEFIEKGKESTIEKLTEPYKKELADLSQRRKTKEVEEGIAFDKRMIEQTISQVNNSYEIATKLYKVVDGEVFPKYKWKVGDKVLWDGKVETEIEEVDDDINHPLNRGQVRYKVKKIEGIHNPYISYDGLFPIKQAEPLQEPEKVISQREKAQNQINAITLSVKFLKGEALEKAKARLNSLQLSIKYLK